ncbi:MAG TPA: ATP-grasp domain-containing protein [Opitutaceae bacterium]|nr:ATP-grasp domain-containing protein [Opitutaceae bacterium]
MSKTAAPLELASRAEKPLQNTARRVLLVYRKFTSSFIYYPWMLSRAGLEIDVVCGAKHEIRRSRSLSHVYIADDTDESFYELVVARLKSGEYGFLLLVDEPSRGLMYNRETVDPAIESFLPVLRTNPLADAFTDKERFQNWCEGHGIPVPVSRIVKTPGEALQWAEEWLFPVVLKGTTGMGGAAVIICKDATELRNGFIQLASSTRVMVQQYISGPVGSTAFVALRGKVAAWVASEKYIALKDGIGPSAVRRVHAHPELGRIAQQMAAAGEVTGLTGFDWMEIAPGQYVVIDPHIGRCTPPGAVAHLSGVDFGRAILELIEGRATLQQPRDDSRVIVLFPQVVELILQGGLLTLLRKASPFHRGVKYYFGPWREMRLSLHVFWSYLRGSAKVTLGAMRSRLRLAA